jgi:hypothetical protein
MIYNSTVANQYFEKPESLIYSLHDARTLQKKWICDSARKNRKDIKEINKESYKQRILRDSF